MNIQALTFAVALSCAVALPTRAAAPAPAAKVQSSAASAARLSALCDTCAVVDTVATETRKGKASGVGVVGGAVVGGLLGHQIGGGSGKTLATVGGAVAGGVAGNEIEKRTKKHTVWVTRVTLKNGTQRSFEQGSAPGFKAGDVVSVEGNHLVRK